MKKLIEVVLPLEAINAESVQYRPQMFLASRRCGWSLKNSFCVGGFGGHLEQEAKTKMPDRALTHLSHHLTYRLRLAGSRAVIGYAMVTLRRNGQNVCPTIEVRILKG